MLNLFTEPYTGVKHWLLLCLFGESGLSRANSPSREELHCLHVVPLSGCELLRFCQLEGRLHGVGQPLIPQDGISCAHQFQSSRDHMTHHCATVKRLMRTKNCNGNNLIVPGSSMIKYKPAMLSLHNSIKVVIVMQNSESLAKSSSQACTGQHKRIKNADNKMHLFMHSIFNRLLDRKCICDPG